MTPIRSTAAFKVLLQAFPWIDPKSDPAKFDLPGGWFPFGNFVAHETVIVHPCPCVGVIIGRIRVDGSPFEERIGVLVKEVLHVFDPKDPADTLGIVSLAAGVAMNFPAAREPTFRAGTALDASLVRRTDNAIVPVGVGDFILVAPPPWDDSFRLWPPGADGTIGAVTPWDWMHAAPGEIQALQVGIPASVSPAIRLDARGNYLDALAGPGREGK